MTSKGEQQDSVIVIAVGLDNVRNMRVYGQNQLDTKELTGEKSTMIL